MVKVITYGTYDLLHYGHISLLKRAKELGDYLIVGITADDFDKSRGKINVKQSLMERIEAVKATGIADEIIVEEYEGQKIDDIRRYNIDIFTVGTDWKGQFDYLGAYCKVIYLERTKGISSSEIRTQDNELKIGIVGESEYLIKFINESRYVNGVEISGLYCDDGNADSNIFASHADIVDSYDELLKNSDAVYVISHPKKHYQHIKKALQSGKNVLCESPVALGEKECKELFSLADEKKLVLMESIKTAYSTAYYRLLLLAKSGRIGDIVSIDATCTSLKNVDIKNTKKLEEMWNSICAWGPTALLPVFQLLGTNYNSKRIISSIANEQTKFDLFTKVDFIYDNAVASIKVGKGVKSEGELVISGTAGYIYVPAPWWKTDYFEIRYEKAENNKRYFYQLDGEGIRYEILAFLKAVETGRNTSYIDMDVSNAISSVIDDYYNGKDMTQIKTIL